MRQSRYVVSLFYQHAISSFISQGDDVLLLHAHCTQKKIVTRSYYLMQCLQNWVLIVVTLVLGISFLHMHVCKNCKSKVLVQYWMTISFKLFSISRKYFNSNSKGWIKAESEFNCRKKVHLIFGMKKKYITYEETVKKIKYIILSI